MITVGLVVHDGRSEAAQLAREAAAWLAERDHESRLTHHDAKTSNLDELGVDESVFGEGLDLVVSLGGDGTMLRAAGLVAGLDVPIIGVNLGDLGYLASVEPSGLRMALKRFLSGSYDVDERMMVDVSISSASGLIADDSLLALNEAVIEKTITGHTVRLRVSIDGDVFTTYAADGIIVATPTGSTAYSMSARGPIVSPRHRAMLVTPVSPHMLFDRALVLGPSESVQVEVVDAAAALVVDGRVVGELRDGDTVHCQVSATTTHMVRFGPTNFHQILKSKFGLSDR